MKIIFMGTPDFAVKILEALANAGHEILSVYTQPDKPRGRGKKLSPSDVKQFALCKGYEVYTPLSLKDDEIFDKISGEAPDLIVVAAYGRILPKRILDIPKHGCINVHASILPKYRGAAPIQWSVINGDRETGVTIMQMGEGLDTGDIIKTEKTEITDSDTSGTMFEKLSVIGARLVVDVIEDMENGKTVRTPQNEAEATYAPMLNKQMTNIDWSLDAQKLHDLIRGLNPFYIAKTSYGSTVLKIHETKVCKGSGLYGEVLENNGSLVVACGGLTALQLLKVQGENGKVMPAADYLRGHSIEKGVIFK